jgi:hypothetical protein
MAKPQLIIQIQDNKAWHKGILILLMQDKSSL